MSGTTNADKSRVEARDGNAAARIDNHPASRRLVRQVYLEELRASLPDYLLPAAILVLYILVGVFWLG
jgi:hypothetical protein